MTLEDVQLPVTLEWGRAHALVFDHEMATRLAAVHATHGSRNCVAVPRQLSDGRLMLRADLLTEVMPGGLLHSMWEAADQAVLLPNVTVIPWADALALLPVDPDE